MQPTCLKSDDVSLGIPPAWPGQGYGASFIFRTLSPICILVLSRTLLASVVLLDLCIVSVVLDSVSRSCINMLFCGFHRELL